MVLGDGKSKFPADSVSDGRSFWLEDGRLFTVGHD